MSISPHDLRVEYWVNQLVVNTAALAMPGVLAYLVFGSPQNFGPIGWADLAVVLLATVPAHLTVQVIGGLLAGCRLRAIEIGVGRVIAERPSPRISLLVRWLPIRIRLGFALHGSVRLPRLRFAVPRLLPLAVAFVLWPLIKRVDGPPLVALGAMIVIFTAAPFGFAARIPPTVYFLSSFWRQRPEDLAERVRPFIDPRVRRVSALFFVAQHRRDVHAAHLLAGTMRECTDSPWLRADYDLMLARLDGDFSRAAQIAATIQPTRTTINSEISYLVVAAVEAGQPVPPDVVAFARAEPLARKLRGTASDAVAAGFAHACLMDGYPDHAIDWGRLALRLIVEPARRVEVLMTLGAAYALRGRMAESERALSTVERIDPRHPRLPHVRRAAVTSLDRQVSS